MTSSAKASLVLEGWFLDQKEKHNLEDIKFFVGDLSKHTTDNTCADIIDFVEAPAEESSSVFEEHFVQKTEDQLLRDLELIE